MNIEEKILFVDDDVRILSAYKRKLRKHFKVETAVGGGEGLETLREKGPFAVVISDMKMPGMDGIEFLTIVRETAPDTVRMMLTGYAEVSTAMNAVNEGNIFRFLTKPCPPELLVKSLRAGLEQYRLVIAEKDILDKTLSGTIRTLTEILSMMDPKLFDRLLTLRESIRTLALHLKIPNVWELEIAAMLSKIGQVTIPPMVMVKAQSGRPLTPVEKEMINRAPQVGYDLLSRIPRLENVAKIILYQNKYYNGLGLPKDRVKEKQIPLGSRLLKILSDLTQLQAKGYAMNRAFDIMASRTGWYDPKLLSITSRILLAKDKQRFHTDIPSQQIKLAQLRPGHLLTSHILTKDNMLLVSAGQRITDALLLRISNWAKITGIREPIFVAEETPKTSKAT